MADVNYVFVLSLIIITIGYVIKRINIITEENGKTIAKIIFNITLPALIFKVITSIKITPSLGLIVLIAILYGIIVLILALMIFKNNQKDAKGLLIMTSIGFNVVHLSYPLIEGIWGQEGLKYIAMFDIGNGFVVFVMCYIIGSIFSKKNESANTSEIAKNSVKQLLISIPLISYFIAIPINLLSVELPLFIFDLLEILSRANSALTLLLLGVFLNFRFDKSQWNNVLKVLILRYSFGLFIGLLLFFTLPFELLYRGIITIALVLPIGLAIIPFTIEFEYDEKLAGMMVNLTIIISFILLWILIIALGFG